MSMIRAHNASFVATLVLATLSSTVGAQELLTEQSAIGLALARDGIAARDAADRDAAAASAAAVTRFENPLLSVARESAGGEREWQVGVVQPIDVTGQRGALRKAARFEAEAVGHDVLWRRAELIAATRSAFVGCSAKSAEFDVWQRYRRDIGEAKRVAEARAAAGDTAVYDLRRTRVALASADAELGMADGERKAGCTLLAALTGTSAPQIPPSAITELTDGGAPGQRADLAAQEQRVMAATQRVSAAQRARWPQLVAGAGVKRVEDQTGAAYGPTVSVGITLPIFNSGKAAVTEAEARKRAHEAELIIARRNIEAQQQAASIRVMAAREAAVSAARSRDDAARLGGTATTAYQAGEIGVVELLDAFEAQRDAELSVISHALRAAEAAIEFDLVNGRTYP